MGKRKLRENTRRRPPWGATKKTAKELEALRFQANRVHTLENSLRSAQIAIEQLVTERDNFRRLLDSVCDPKKIQALRRVCSITLAQAVGIDLQIEIISLCLWLREFDSGVLANVTQALSAADGASVPARPLGTIPNAEPLMPRPSGIIKRKNDEDDPDSIDDLFAKAVDIHLERMDDDYYWMGITAVGGQTVHIDFHAGKNRKMRARVRK